MKERERETSQKLFWLYPAGIFVTAWVRKRLEKYAQEGSKMEILGFDSLEDHFEFKYTGSV